MNTSSLVQVTALSDINLGNVWYVEIGEPGADNLPNMVRFYFSETFYRELTGEDAKNYARARAAFMPKLSDAPRTE